MIIFYPIEVDFPFLWDLVTALKLHSCGTLLQQDAGRFIDGCQRWSTVRGNTVLTCATLVAAPALYGGNLAGARSTSLSTFCGAGSTGEYVVGTKWYTRRTTLTHTPRFRPQQLMPRTFNDVMRFIAVPTVELAVI